MDSKMASTSSSSGAGAAEPVASTSTGRMAYTSNLGSSEFCLPWSQGAYNFGSFTTTPVIQPDDDLFFDQGLSFFGSDMMTSNNPKTDAEIIRARSMFLEQAEILERAIDKIPTEIQRQPMMQFNDVAEATNEVSEARALSPVTGEFIDRNNNNLKDERLFVNLEQELYKLKAELDLEKMCCCSKHSSTNSVRVESNSKKPVLRNNSKIPTVMHFNGYENYNAWQMMLVNNSLMNHHVGQLNNNYLPFKRPNVIDVHHYHYPEHLFEQIFPKNPAIKLGYTPEYIAEQAYSMGMPICDENIFSPENANSMIGPDGQPQFPTMLHHFKVPAHLQEALKTKTLILQQVCG